MRWTLLLMLAACSAKEETSAQITDGVQIVYSMDLDAVVDEHADAIKHALRAELKRAAIEADVRTTPGGLSVTVADPARRAEAAAIVKAQQTLQAQECPAICARVTDAHAVTLRKAALDQGVAVIRKRVAGGKVRANVTANGESIVVDLARADDEALHRTRDIVARVGRLQLRAVDNNAPFMKDLVAQVQADSASGLEATMDEVDVHIVAFDRERIRRYVDDLARRDPRFTVPEDRQIGYERVDRQWRTHYLVRDVAVSARTIKTVGVQGDKTTGTLQLVIELDSAGASALAELTTQQTGKRIAVIVDGTIKTVAVVTAPLTNGKLSIALGGDAAEATELATVLRSPLPAPLREETVSELRGGKVIPPPP